MRAEIRAIVLAKSGTILTVHQSVSVSIHKESSAIEKCRYLRTLASLAARQSRAQSS